MSTCREKMQSKNPSMNKLKSICVFGGSTIGRDEEFLKAATELGKTLAARKINLVYGGGIHGLKGSMAGSALIGGGKVLGIVLKFLADRNPSHFTIGTELKVSSIYERLGYMLYNADAFIALPGGLGTLEEISSIASWAKLSFHKKPLGLLNINGFYDGLLSFLDKAVEQGFVHQTTRSVIVSASNVDQLIDLVQSFVPTPSPSIKLEELHTKDERRKRKEPDTTLRL